MKVQVHILLIFQYNYRTRAINHRGFYSKITILALKLSHKKRIKIAFQLKTLGGG